MMKTSPELRLDYHYFSSPLGWILLAGGPRGISLVHFCGPAPLSRDAYEKRLQQLFPEADAFSYDRNLLLDEAEKAVLDYLHNRRPLAPLPLDLRTGTPFRHQVWKALEEIPFGQTRSYLQIAQAIGSPRSSRAVGQACGSNPAPLFIPCHRVVAADGSLGGFSGGIHIKETLLEIERSSGGDVARG
jgi:methylated-DNA-[protein]-cysteine S-methyltransferase